MKPLLILAITWFSPSPDSGFHITDFVEAPGGWAVEGGSGTHLEFSEYWQVDPDRCAIRKEVVDCNPGINRSGSINLQGKKEVSYEFNFLDPHIQGTGDRDVWEPSMMDPSERRLQHAFIELVKSCLFEGRAFDLEEMLLSLVFHETWSYDPETEHISKEVWAITPVIWQRRQTSDGEPVNEADSGMPVYYKTKLARIRLRNP